MEFKPFYKNNHDAQAPHRLQELGEARGKLLRVFESEGQCVGVWAWGCCSFPEEMEPQLREMVGREVACLRLDGKYHLRSVD
jgi:hypothetical protein